MKGLINRIEKGLLRFVVLCFLVMVVVQGLMTVDPVRFYLSWGERMEGQSIEIPASSPAEETSPAVGEMKSPQAYATIAVNKFSSLPKTKILINGQEKYNLTQKQVAIELNAGDTVEIDSTAYNFPIDYQIGPISSNLAYPQSGQTFTANQTIVMVGKVIVK